MEQKNKEQMYKSDRPHVALREEMDKQIEQARSYLTQAMDLTADIEGQVLLQRRSSRRALKILEELKGRMTELETQVSLSETPLSEATVKPEETPPTSTTSSTWSSRVSPGGYLPMSVRRDISDWLSSQHDLGPEREVVIGLTLGSKGTTSQSGSASQSTQPAPESVSTSSSSSGAHGEAARRDTSSVSGPEVSEHHAEVCRASHQWIQTYRSHDENRNLEALEFRCQRHHVSFWLALPPKTSPVSESSESKPGRYRVVRGKHEHDWLVMDGAISISHSVTEYSANRIAAALNAGEQSDDSAKLAQMRDE